MKTRGMGGNALLSVTATLGGAVFPVASTLRQPTSGTIIPIFGASGALIEPCIANAIRPDRETR